MFTPGHLYCSKVNFVADTNSDVQLFKNWKMMLTSRDHCSLKDFNNRATSSFHIAFTSQVKSGQHVKTSYYCVVIVDSKP